MVCYSSAALHAGGTDKGISVAAGRPDRPGYVVAIAGWPAALHWWAHHYSRPFQRHFAHRPLVLVLTLRIELAFLVALNRLTVHLAAETDLRRIADSLPRAWTQIPVALKSHHPEVRIRRLSVVKNLPVAEKNHRLALKILRPVMTPVVP